MFLTMGWEATQQKPDLEKNWKLQPDEQCHVLGVSENMVKTEMVFQRYNGWVVPSSVAMVEEPPLVIQSDKNWPKNATRYY